MIRTDGTGNWWESDWDVAIEAVEGGLVEVDGLFSNVAPDGGYVDRIDVSSRDSGQWQSETEKHFFHRERAGGPYARLTVNLRPLFRETEGRIRVDYVVNTSGTKDLSTFTGYHK